MFKNILIEKKKLPRNIWNPRLQLRKRLPKRGVQLPRNGSWTDNSLEPIIHCGVKKRYVDEQIEKIEDVDELKYMKNLIASDRYFFIYNDAEN